MGKNSKGIPKKIKQEKIHKSKYSRGIMGTQEKSKLISMLSELRNMPGIEENKSYKDLRNMKSKSCNYYYAVKSLYYKYFN